MFTLAVFDMAGTTINDRDEVYRVLREATEREGARYSDDQFQEWMGTEKKWAIRNLLEIGGVEPGEELVEKRGSGSGRSCDAPTPRTRRFRSTASKRHCGLSGQTG
ncbi:hypothetical protein QP028_12090 [Corynebacterium suedekumii]|nr:hypothetical protein QP028_12090 [Corynebacterium suedekumii]